MLSETDTSFTEDEDDEDGTGTGEENNDEYVLNTLEPSTSSGTTVQVKKEACVIINQFVSDIIDFSSQYGSDFSISYTAFNLTGKPSKYPDFGDFPETFAFRSYGNWWNIAPSRMVNFMPQNFENIPKVDDYIVCKFEDYVYPHEIHIFETYNPGAIVRIWVYTIHEKWWILWDKEQDVATYPIPQFTARIFSPKLKKSAAATRIVRIEFDHSNLGYFTQIDAIMLIGKKYRHVPVSRQNAVIVEKGPIQRRVELERFCVETLNKDREKIMEEFLKSGLGEFMRDAGRSDDAGEMSSSSSSSTLSNRSMDQTHFALDNLPYEVLFNIMSFLDLKSLFQCSRVCKKFYEISANDPVLYRELNLKPYWSTANSNLIKTLTKRCANIKKIDLSWCGLLNKITPVDFKDFIKQCGTNLTHLRLNCCKFLNTSCIDRIGMRCTFLKELTIQNYHCLNDDDMTGLYGLKHLERLDLSRTDINTWQLTIILENNRNMKHLNLGFCGLNVNMDEVAVAIGKFNMGIVSLDMWKSHSLTSRGLLALSSCQDLEEVDFGWCLREEPSPGESLRKLVMKCPKLKKLFLAAIRGLTDRDLDVIANYCVDIEQLDLMGIMGISTEMCYHILCKCKKLKFIDLSFCDQLDVIQIGLWHEIFDVSIKRSFNDLPI